MPCSNHVSDASALHYLLCIEIIFVTITQRPRRVSSRYPNVKNVTMWWKHCAWFANGERIYASFVVWNEM